MPAGAAVGARAVLAVAAGVTSAAARSTRVWFRAVGTRVALHIIMNLVLSAAPKPVPVLIRSVARHAADVHVLEHTLGARRATMEAHHVDRVTAFSTRTASGSCCNN